ncbi:hypothetical protein BH11BAC2_BH11BAC2_16570 [soil metagenome]
MNVNQNEAKVSTVNEREFRESVMPRALLSKMACEIALLKTTDRNVEQFASWELMEATTVINVLQDLGTTVSSLDNDSEAFLEKLKSLSGNGFDKVYMEAELSNHEFLLNLTQDYIDGSEGKPSGPEENIWHVANLALFAFTEHVAICKRIVIEVSGN